MYQQGQRHRLHGDDPARDTKNCMSASPSPVYRRPSNLFVRGTSQNSAGLPNKGEVFRKIGRRKLVPYYDRAQIEDGAIAGRGLEIVWLKNQTDLLFTQIQGSARVRLEDGSTVRINYDAHNGFSYTPVGRILIERSDTRWAITGTATKLKLDTALWNLLADPTTPPEIGPQHVHFLLVPEEIARQHRRLTTTLTDSEIRISF